jgi:hypothetical protein
MSIISDEAQQHIGQILKRGNAVELKKENGKLVVVEIQRKVKSKTTF